MSKEKEKKVENKVKKAERKKVVVDDEKKKVISALLQNILDTKSFPSLNPDEIKSLSEASKVPEKTLKAFCGKLEKFAYVIARGKKEKKGKEVEAGLLDEIKEVAQITATRIAQKLFKTTATFSSIDVAKKGKTHTYGKAIFTLGNKKEHFLSWDFKEGDLFVGSTLHEYTDAIKNGNKKDKDKEKKEDKK